MEISYRHDITPTSEKVIELYNNSGLSRPTNDNERIEKMLVNASMIISAWDDQLLVGISRSITDWVWCCYLADLAVRHDYQKLGIGKRLIELTKERVGHQSMVLLLSVPTAMDYYPKVGFTRDERSFIINRSQ